MLADALWTPPDVVEMSRAETVLLARLHEVMQRLRLGVFCTSCNMRGKPDGVAFGNGDADSMWTATCGCTERKGLNPMK